MEPRAPRIEEWTNIEDFLKKNLRNDIKWSFKDEYPLAFDRKNIGNIRIISDEERILSHAVLKPTIMKTNWHVFKVGFIGSVVTDEESRGQGLSQTILNSCIDSAEKQDCDFVMLWTDLFDFYEKVGFEIAGTEIAIQLDRNFNAPMKDLKIIEGGNISADALLRVYNKHNLRSVRTVSDIRNYLKIPQTRIYSAWNRMTNSLEAYLIEGKGVDFTNYIHEWGGNVSSILSLLRTMTKMRKDPLSIILPPQSQNLQRKLLEHGGDLHKGILGMIRISNRSSLTKKIKKAARAQGFDQFIFEYRDGKYYFGNGTEVYQTDSDRDMIRLIFGPLKPEQIHPFSNEVSEVFNEIFPIPFWVWGWDSI